MRNLLIIYLIVLLPMVGLAQQPGRLTKKYFPNPGVEMKTPALAKKSGFTNYRMMIEFLEALQDSSERVKVTYVGETRQGKQIPVVFIGNEQEGAKVRVWMQGGIHGNEPASAEGMLAVIQALTQPEQAHLFDRLDVMIAPMVNIDGYMRQNRHDSKGLDMNRDLVKLQVPEIQQVRKVYEKYQPHVAIDFHEFNPFRRVYRSMGRMGATIPYDAMFLYSGDLNVEPKIRELTESLFVKRAKDHLESLNYTHRDYISPQDRLGKLYFNEGASSARSSATSFALGNAVSVLMEIRGIRLNRTSFERRVFITRECALSYLQTAYLHADEVVSGVEEAIGSTLRREREVVVTSSRTRETRPVEFIDFDSNERISTEQDIATARQMKPELVRDRPYAYLLMPDQETAAEKLTILGLEVEQLMEQTRLEVEVYDVKSVQEAPIKFQGYFPATAETELVTTEMDIPAGAFIVRLNQKNANLAVTALEPENQDGFVRTRVVPVVKGKPLPVYRLMKNAELDVRKFNLTQK